MVAVTVRTALDAMIVDNIDVPILGLVSGGLYAGPHREKLLKKYIHNGETRTHFMDLIDQILCERVTNDGTRRGQYFAEVVLAGMRHPAKAQSDYASGHHYRRGCGKGRGKC